MALPIVSIQEIQQALTSTGHSMLSSGRAHGESNYEYERGVCDALKSMALAFGIEWDAVIAQIREVTS